MCNRARLVGEYSHLQRKPRTLIDIRFTQITSHSCDLTKRFALDEHGRVTSSAIAHMTEGAARVLHVDDVSHLDAALRNLTPNQAITCGLPRAGDSELTTRARADFNPRAVARTNATFDWSPGATLCPIDVDVDTGGFTSLDAALDALEACHPWLAHVTRIARPSSSSYVGDRGLRGVHVYFAVTRGTDIPALAVRMQAEEWLAGRGLVKISKSGALLVRQLSDSLVYQPSRLMFEAEPVCSEDVPRNIPDGGRVLVRAERPKGAPLRARTPEGLLDVGALTPLREIDMRRFETMKRQARDARRREAKKIAINYQRENAIANGLEIADGERLGLIATRALGDKKLPATWELAIKDIGRQTVQQVVDALPLSLGFNCADPFDTWNPNLEPKHYDKAEIVMMGDRPGVWSHKLQEFFEFTDDRAADLDTPLSLAAEKLCGLVEYPEPAGKKSAPLVNITHGLTVLLDELDALPSYNASTGTMDRDDVPDTGDLLDALSRIGCHNVTKKPIEDAIDTLAYRRTVDPWRDAVLGLPKWDGTPRLDNFFPELCSAMPSEALMLSTQLFFAGVLMRQLKPGAPCPVVPVLIGQGGLGKGVFVADMARALGVPPPASLKFADEIRMTMAASVSAIAELGEMSGMAKRDVEDIKQWTTECQDVYRAPYEKRASAHPRRFALIGTANKHEMNRDETGNRRLMPVDVLRPIEQAWAGEARQIFAEAKARFVDDEATYLRLVRAAADAVFAFNQAQMRDGIGVPVSDVDDVLPDLLRKLLRQHSATGFVPSSAIRTALDALPSGKMIRTREYTRWLTTRGWQPARTMDARGWKPPEGYEAPGESNVIPLSPFAKVGN